MLAFRVISKWFQKRLISVECRCGTEVFPIPQSTRTWMPSVSHPRRQLTPVFSSFEMRILFSYFFPPYSFLPSISLFFTSQFSFSALNYFLLFFLISLFTEHPRQTGTLFPFVHPFSCAKPSAPFIPSAARPALCAMLENHVTILENKRAITVKWRHNRVQSPPLDIMLPSLSNELIFIFILNRRLEFLKNIY